jgi:hypothetical protein
MSVPELKTRLGIPVDDITQDDLLALVLADAQAFFKDYCNREDVPPEAESVIARLAVVLYSRNADQYKQGTVVGAYSTTNFVLGDDIPKSIKSQLRKYRVVKLI